MSALFIHNIGALVTPLAADRDAIERNVDRIDSASILIEGGRIAKVGKESELTAEVAPDVPRMDARGALVLPGFIDCHTHPVFVGNRADEFHMRNAGKSYLEIAAAGGGIQASAQKTRGASVERIVRDSLPRFRRSLRCGVTAMEGKSGYGLTWEGEERLLMALKEAEKQIPQKLNRTFLIHALPKEFAREREQFCDQVADRMIPEVAERELASAVDVFCETGAFSVEESRRFLSKAKEFNLDIRVHANQFGNSGGALLAAELGARSADHLEYLNETEIRALCDAGVIGVVLPACVFFMNSIPYPPVRDMIEAGMRVAVATDLNPGTSMTESIPFCMTAAAAYCRMTPEELLWSVTLDPARVLGMDSEIGSIEPGKAADLSFWNMPNLESISYFFGSTEPVRVMIDGKVVFESDDESRTY